ncbi:MAG: hypothetical protein JSR82_19510 [Verrucomicrobia bacterium]|nr:hypothetical protein [Verrucomicrobiota bacterium]
MKSVVRVLCAWLALVVASSLSAQEAKPASDPAAPPANPKPPTQEEREQLRDLVIENEVLRQAQENIQQTLRTLTESLAVANAEAEVFRRKYAELQTRLEALGLTRAQNSDREALEQRLLKAVSDLELAKAQVRKLADQTAALSEAALRFSKSVTGASAAARLELEAQLRSANDILSAAPASAPNAPPPPTGLFGGAIISLKDEYALIVLNLGKVHGLRVGMPVKVVRDDRIVARALVVDVREKLSGAILQDPLPTGSRLYVGDQVRVDSTPASLSR